MPHATLDSALRRGEVDSCPLADGTLIVPIAAAKRWAAVPRKRGPKPRK